MKKLYLIAGAMAVLAASAGVSRADLIVNGGFETGDFTGWTVVAGATEVTTTFAGYDPNSGTYFAALGNVGCCGTLSQTFADTVGQTYDLSFWLASNGTTPSEFEAEIDGTAVYGPEFNIPESGASSPFPYDEITETFVGTGSDTLTFVERNDPSYLALDDVSVNSAAVGVPEPASLALFGAGLVGFGAIRRRKRNAA